MEFDRKQSTPVKGAKIIKEGGLFLKVGIVLSWSQGKGGD